MPAGLPVARVRCQDDATRLVEKRLPANAPALTTPIAGWRSPDNCAAATDRRKTRTSAGHHLSASHFERRTRTGTTHKRVFQHAQITPLAGIARSLVITHLRATVLATTSVCALTLPALYFADEPRLCHQDLRPVNLWSSRQNRLALREGFSDQCTEPGTDTRPSVRASHKLCTAVPPLRWPGRFCNHCPASAFLDKTQQRCPLTVF